MTIAIYNPCIRVTFRYQLFRLAQVTLQSWFHLRSLLVCLSRLCQIPLTGYLFWDDHHECRWCTSNMVIYTITCPLITNAQ